MPGENPRQAGLAVSGGKDSASDQEEARDGLAQRGPRLLRTTAFALFASAAAGLPARVAFAADGALSVSTFEVIQIAVSVGVFSAALLSAIWLIRERGRTFDENGVLRAKVADLSTALQRSEAMLNLRDQRVIVWSNEHKKPELVGSLSLESGAPEDRSAFLAFGRWLTPRSAAALDHAIMALREKSAGFDLTVEAANGAGLEVQGRRTARQVIVRFVSLSEVHRANARLKLENQRLS